MTNNNINYNRSVYCILPILNMIRTELLYKKGLLNCHLNCNLLDGYKNHIFVTYNKNINIKFPKFIEKMMSHELFEDVVEFNHLYVLIFKIPNEFKEDIDYFKRGMYSKFSKKHKALIHKCHFLNPTKKLFKILWKKLEYKEYLEEYLDVKLEDDAELWSIPNNKDIDLTV